MSYEPREGEQTAQGQDHEDTGLYENELRYDDLEEDEFLLELINASGIEPNYSNLASRRAHAIAITEHAVSSKKKNAAKARMREKGWGLELSDPDPDARNTRGGTSLMTRNLKVPQQAI